MVAPMSQPVEPRNPFYVLLLVAGIAFTVTVLAQNDGGGFFVGLGAFVLAIWFLVIAASMFWMWMLIDALVNEPTPNDRILWFLVIFFLHFLGALIYFFIGKPRGTGAV